jgi:hypothetical protein
VQQTAVFRRAVYRNISTVCAQKLRFVASCLPALGLACMMSTAAQCG